MELQAGAAKVDITPRTPQQLMGYGPKDRYHEGIHHPLSARALYLRGDGGDAVLVTLDLIFIAEESMERVRIALERELDVPAGHVWIGATHTHAAPDVFGEKADHEWLAMVENQIVAAAALAKTRLSKSRLSFARGACAIGNNRREKLPSGEVILGCNPNGPVDRELLVLALDTAQGRPIARVANFACHGTVLGYKNRTLSGDWPGSAALKIESKLDGGLLLFINGGAGNVNPAKRGHTDPAVVDEIAEGFCAAFWKTCAEPRPLPDDASVGGASLELHLPRKLCEIEAGKGKTARVSVHGLRIGPVRLAGFPGEVFSETTLAVRERAPHPCTLLASYACGCAGGYVPVAEAYADGGYEVMRTPYSEGGEAVLREGFLRLLKEM